MNDAFSVCSDAIPDHGKVAACLAKNINRISIPCRTVMLRYQQPAVTANVSKPAATANVYEAGWEKAAKGPMNIKPKISEARAGSRS